MLQFRELLIQLTRRQKQGVMWAADVIGALFALAAAMVLHGYSPLPLAQGGWALVAVIGSLTLACWGLGLYSVVIRFLALKAALRIAFAAGATLAMVWLLQTAGLIWLAPAPVLINFALLLILSLGGSRALARSFLTRLSDRDASRLLIYGAGDAGVKVAEALSADRNRRVVGFVDDRRDLKGAEVAGFPVHAVADLPGLIERQRVDAVLLALPSVSRRRRQEIVAELEDFSVRVQTVPSINEILSGKARVDEIRNIDIEDLLGRDPVPPDKRLLAACIQNKVVMVTGGGGSIGSELARQIAEIGPDRLILLDVSENALYEIERELQDAYPGVKTIPVLGNVINRGLLERLMQDFKVQTVYHAAAYKHVPLVEQNSLGAIHNNIMGTWNAAESAVAAGVETFVLISTDKAVRPTNVMGASKRCAELVLQGIDQRLNIEGQARPVFSMVRFGNVLGSSGSVVPLFNEQIRAGGPLTVTHPQVIRYFMTASEAANLVIQAGAMAQGGEVFVLDMGEPVRIFDLAKRMVQLAGLDVASEDNPEGEIAIRYTGLRPGEKLYEELLIGGDVAATRHSKIWQASEELCDWEALWPQLTHLEHLCNKLDCEGARAYLVRLVHDYSPAEPVHDHLWTVREEGGRDKLEPPSLLTPSKLQ